MTAPLVIWTSKECAEAVGVSLEIWGNLTRDPDARAIMPQPFGKAGNARLWDPAIVQAAIPKLREWVAGTQTRARAKQRLALARQDEEFARRQAMYAGAKQ